MPEYLTEWRPRQLDGLAFFQQSRKRVKAVCAPTGSGKSELVVGEARRTGLPTCIVTDSRALQDQYMTRFESLGMVDLRGRANYKCAARPDDPDYTCEHGYAARCPLKGSHSCEASSAEMRAATSLLVITNYAKWIHNRRYGIGLSHIKRVVFDEGHEAPNALSQAMQVRLFEKEVGQLLGLDFPEHDEALFFSTWKQWANDARVSCEYQLSVLRQRLLNSNVDPLHVKAYTHLRNLSRRLAILATASVKNWIVEEVKHGYQFDPIAPAIYSESALLLKVPDITVISATLRPKTLFMMGIGQVDFDFVEYLSDFDPRRCPIYYVPTMRVDGRAANLMPVWLLLDQVASQRRDRNGIVHTISFARRNEVLASSRFAPHMFINEQGEPATAMIEEFKAAYPGAILVSPSVGQGFDFAFQAAEWQFICKIPFPPPSKILSARTELDRDLPYYLAMQKLQQIAGRIMRDSRDQGETIIPDDHLIWFLTQHGHLASKSFAQFFRRVEYLPPPPERLGV